MASSIAAVICAAGFSSRMGGIKKEYQRLRGRGRPITVLGSAVCAFTAVPFLKTIVIAVPENGENEARQALPPDISKSGGAEILFVNGGSTRRASVFNALTFLAPYSPDYVLIHDGARPWLNSYFIEDIIVEVKKHGAVIPVLPLTDTPKEYDRPLDGSSQAVFVINHLKRANTGIAQTPQAFKFQEILEAHKKAAQVQGEEFTDDAEIWGRFCGPVAVIPGSLENRKITFMEDFY